MIQEEEEVRHRVNLDEKKILDEDEQQQVIDELTKECESMVRVQKKVFLSVSSVLTILAIAGGIYTQLYQPFFFAAITYVALVFCEYINSIVCWVAMGVAEFCSIYSTYKYVEELTKPVALGIHTTVTILVVFWISSYHFFAKFPDKIDDLQNLKYGKKSV